MTAFRVPDMTCGSCAGRIQRAIVATDDTARIEISVRDRLVQISGAATDAEFAEAIQEAGYTPELVQQSAGPASTSGDARSGGCCGATARRTSCCG
ncbi:TPA: heavy-metal-associated domain-containing protein [Pseudomonas aeruginosa]|uniref:heavy-metal-associated domain-containing protein n=2 Tax=Pseudomonas aeruginosa TaxID=287 RepID=UPI0003D32FDA|nr:heavy-metal-associated domain-containing protein [Pseudomonas aeruginosa]ETD74114.1 Heavy-metal-associated domain-containing protein [Pseudomonas aeruginosa VRFPA06]EJV1386268.1 heavy-metal-associated domain-containing protein [Pseudomonas aeruginosa]EJV1609518.1 heavy-metal-associated domain-containing protein [Pseudomonas aeruginosa]EKD1566358.1 heavy-metal-associated domain-containing protein [Pseudomonas aeruginosa]